MNAMTPKLLIICLSLATTLAVATPKSPTPPPLQAQVQRLVELLRDPYAMGYPEATIFQTIDLDPTQKIALVIFTIEGFGGGNNHTQYLAAFNIQSNEQGTDHYSMIDVIPVGGKGWRGIENLNAKFRRDDTSGEVVFKISALEVTGEDALNFPSKKIKINIILKDGRLFEKTAT
ncbi:hypothetical protein ACFPTX_01160 [Pseudomonas sp. GCM10022188]|uniref:hypothetical protein n=1 Tax=Pseudomonas TaxID=286 RepID=UPI001E5CA21B|nr:hypothetical protein [Pseudomonas oryzagri]MCC6075212.1 hypothetical protein [Pseudomonas oryzagri]